MARLNIRQKTLDGVTQVWLQLFDVKYTGRVKEAKEYQLSVRYEIYQVLSQKLAKLSHQQPYKSMSTESGVPYGIVEYPTSSDHFAGYCIVFVAEYMPALDIWLEELCNEIHSLLGIYGGAKLEITRSSVSE